MSDKGMIFEVGKTYKHITGKRMTIIGRLKTHIYGECLIGEYDTGELVPVGEAEENTINWYEDKKQVNDVFERIKTEIMKIQTYKTFLCEDYVKRDDVLAIIDKCKEESKWEN